MVIDDPARQVIPEPRAGGTVCVREEVLVAVTAAAALGEVSDHPPLHSGWSVLQVGNDFRVPLLTEAVNLPTSTFRAHLRVALDHLVHPGTFPGDLLLLPVAPPNGRGSAKVDLVPLVVGV